MTMLSFGPATLDDVDYVADILTENDPDDPADPAIIGHFWSNPQPGTVTEPYVITGQGGERIGYAYHHHQEWSKLPVRFGRVNAWLRSAKSSGELLDEAYAHVEDRSRESGTAVFLTNSADTDVLRQQVLAARGYAEERRFKLWECDLRANAAMLRQARAESRRKMNAEQVRLTSFDRIADPDKTRRFWELSETTTADMPSTVPYVSAPFEAFVQGWMGRPGFREDRLWIAQDGDRMLGYSVLAYPPTRGLVWNNGTAVIREARGRGLARALKLESMVQAVDAGTPRIRTGNDSTNAPILHLNEVLGFTPVPGGIQFKRSA
ncbi:MAG TPA: GNAT family N-acetyltransferase [Candidatus Saccharimonadales bacterium]|nr:GNAT family N-acetyltransferase [Candidatus Saccharimonadales bacterium]